MSDAPTTRSDVRRKAERGVYDREVMDAILDEALMCHVGMIHNGYPVVIPTIHARVGETLYFHGSPASRILREMKKSAEVCVSVTLVDGLVVARAAFHNSMNYRSVIVYGEARIVDEPDEKRRALNAVTDHVMLGRAADSRPNSAHEIKSTLVMAVLLDEASAKARAGGPVDDEEDYALDVWAGVVPLQISAGDPEPDGRLPDRIAVPDYLTGYTRG